MNRPGPRDQEISNTIDRLVLGTPSSAELDRRIRRMVESGDYLVREIGEALGLKPDAVSQRLKRMRDKEKR